MGLALNKNPAANILERTWTPWLLVGYQGNNAEDLGNWREGIHVFQSVENINSRRMTK